MAKPKTSKPAVVVAVEPVASVEHPAPDETPAVVETATTTLVEEFEQSEAAAESIASPMEPEPTPEPPKPHMIWSDPPGCYVEVK